MRRLMKVKHRFCPLCREWFPWGYGFLNHKCCKKHPSLKMEFGWETVERLKGKEFVAESRKNMQSTQEKDSYKEIARK